MPCSFSFWRSQIAAWLLGTNGAANSVVALRIVDAGHRVLAKAGNFEVPFLRLSGQRLIQQLPNI